MHAGPGFRVRTEIKRVPREIVEQFREFPTPDISDLMNRLYAMRAGITNLVNDQSIVGPACTVKLYPGDNLMLHKSLDVIQPGDVIVVDAAGCDTNAVIGDLVAQKAKHLGAVGIVIDGFLRDLPEMREVGLPVFAQGVTPVGPLHRGPGEINFPICCGGIVVNPGDLIIGDPVGIVVVEQAYCREILGRLIARRDKLANYVKNVRAGNFSNAWVDDLLNDSDCQRVD